MNLFCHEKTEFIHFSGSQTFTVWFVVSDKNTERMFVKHKDDCCILHYRLFR